MISNYEKCVFQREFLLSKLQMRESIFFLLILVNLTVFYHGDNL